MEWPPIREQLISLSEHKDVKNFIEEHDRRERRRFFEMEIRLTRIEEILKRLQK